MPVEESLRFLEGAKSLYYAELDHESLPFREGERLILRTAREQIVYLKALSLVTDYVVVPPSFYFFWVHAHRDTDLVRELTQLYQARIVISPIYTSMNMGTDFLEQKRENGSSLDKTIIDQYSDLLVPFFREMPVIHRNVLRQSSGFRDFLTQEILCLNGPSKLKTNLDAMIFEPANKEVLVSRAQIGKQLISAQNTQNLSRRQFRQYYYTVNRCYYRQGAITYDATISLVGAERYSILGGQMFNNPHGILLAYDPLVVIGILESLGIRRSLLRKLSIDDLVEVRMSPAFAAFRDAYSTFATTLQKLELRSRRVSQRLLGKSKEQMNVRLLAQYFIESDRYERYVKWWNVSEMGFFSLALGAIGFFVIPVVGAVLGLVPIAIYTFGLTPRLSDFVIQRMYEQELPFYLFINELQSVTNQLSKKD